MVIFQTLMKRNLLKKTFSLTLVKKGCVPVFHDHISYLRYDFYFKFNCMSIFFLSWKVFMHPVCLFACLSVSLPARLPVCALTLVKILQMS